MNIKCKWQENNRVLVNPDGQVLPCCYLGNQHYTYNMKDNDKWQDVMKDYDDNKELYNIHSNTMENIISSEWFTKTLPESWEDESKLLWQCKRWCGEKE